MAAVQPSPFAALLRRSKFAAFDPAIAQVYTSYEGNAHRGHWGLKRSLPLRRRDAFITVKSVDSPEQQTEWNNGESQARFIKRWEELGVESQVASPWEKRIGQEAVTTWMVDSEFSPPAISEPITDEKNVWNAERVNAVPNIHAMSNKEFQRYLEKLRKLRPEFQSYIQRLAENDPKGRLQGKSLYELALSREEYHKKFIAWKAANEFNSMESRNIERKPHRTGGLLYSHTSPLQTLFTTTWKPGIILQKTFQPSDRNTIARSESSFIASFAGMTSVLPIKSAGGKRALMDITSTEGIKTAEAENSIINLRIFNRPKLVKGPIVVGRRQGLKGARIETKVTSDLKADFKRSNPHVPGSREYNGERPIISKEGRRPPPMDLIPKHKKRAAKQPLKEAGKELISKLRVIATKSGNFHNDL